MKAKRGKLIIDNDADEGNDDWVADKIRVGLNLAYVEEDVARDFVFSDTKLTMSKGRKWLSGKTNNI